MRNRHFSPERELANLREQAKIERRMQVICALLIFGGLVAMWAYVGYQLNLLEQVH